MSVLGTTRARLCGRRNTGATLRVLWVAVTAVLVGCGDDPATLALAERVCSDVEARRFDAALEASEGHAGTTGAARDIAECRCLAQISMRQPRTCAAELGPLVASPAASDWVPHPLITKVLLHAARAAGDSAFGARLAERAAAAHPEDLDLLQRELEFRSQMEEPGALLAELEARLDSARGDALAQRLVLALAWIDRGRSKAALRVLGEEPPAIDHRYALPWFESRIQAQARDGDIDGVRATFQTWRATGWDEADLRARYALRLSVDHLEDPERSTLALLRASIAEEERLRDRNVVWGLHRRLIVEALAAGRPQEALAAYDAAAGRIDLSGITRRELVEAVRREEGGAPVVEHGRLRLVAPASHAAGRFRLSPPPADPPDVGYSTHPLAGVNAVVVKRRLGIHPVRWIFENENDLPIASGSVWPEAGRQLDVIAVADAVDDEAARSRGDMRFTRRPADGRRRVFAVLADCADWRLTEYLRARGELPFQDHLFESGHRSVLESRPAFTAAAMQALVWPAGADAPSGAPSLRWMHQLGLELAGLEAVGRNPLGALAWVLPRRTGLFETLGAGPHVTANMLLAHGDIAAGRHAEVVGPHGERRTLATRHAHRALSPFERAQYPGLTRDAKTLRFAETIAAEMDAAEAIAEADDVDFLFLRLEALDLMTHAHFAAIDGAGQDDGRGPLLDTYRYVDARLARLDALLDEDDWLVYLSDHGIRSAMQHEEDAIFAVLGEGVPAGRAPGRPALSGVPDAFARMLGVETDWPDSGAAPWLLADDFRPASLESAGRPSAESGDVLASHP